MAGRMNAIFLALAIIFLAPIVSGRDCGGRSCGINAHCVNGSCKCLAPDPVGKPYFWCVEEKNILCSVTSDPHLCTFAEEWGDIPIPCHLGLASFTAGKCRVEAKAHSTQVIGAFIYITRLHVIIKVGTATLGIWMTRGGFVMAYSENGGPGQAVDFDQTVSFGAGEDVILRRREGQHQFYIDAEFCHFQFIFRTHQGSGLRSEQVGPLPGVGIRVAEDLARFPEDSDSFPESLCGDHNRIALSWYWMDNGLNSTKAGVVLGWLRSNVEQVSGTACARAMNTFSTFCDTQEKIITSMDVCTDILCVDGRKCIKNIPGPDNSIMDFFDRCVEALCQQNRVKCEQLVLDLSPQCSFPSLDNACQNLP